LGQFESLIADTARSKQTFRRYCEILERFFGCFPRKHKPQQFHIKDIERYKRSRLGQGISPKTLVLELGVVRSFFNWYRAEYDPDCPNPASTRRPKHISLSDKSARHSGAIKPANNSKLHIEADGESITYGNYATGRDTHFIR
jgi:hypothetical protein